MPAQEWLNNSTQLLKAHPNTTHITTKYNISHAADSPHAPSPTRSHSSHKPRLPKPKAASESTTETQPTTANPAPEPPRATLVLKTYCPETGVSLKYKTNKAAEVSRLIQILGRLGRVMAKLPETEDIVAGDAGAGAGGDEKISGMPVEEKVAGGAKSGGQSQGQGQAGKGKKKGKGKK
ncbi:wd repeat protein [Rutstroemia sp. NJR-2017a BVV2]|nr:wd repeat protein [Rutstroemia sp. NJR-2017a BVV2]